MKDFVLYFKYVDIRYMICIFYIYIMDTCFLFFDEIISNIYKNGEVFDRKSSKICE